MSPNLFVETAKGKVTNWIIVSILIALLLLFVGSFIGTFGVLSIYFAYLFGQASSASGLTQFNLSIDFQTITQLFSFFGIYLSVFAWVRWVEKRPLSSLGLFKKDAVKEIAKGWFFGATLFCFIVLLLACFGMVSLEKVNFSLDSIIWLLIYLVAWQIQSGAEELLTRGWLLPVVATYHRKGVAVAVSSLFFAALHLLNNHVTVLSILNLVLFGLLACLYVVWKGNIWGVFGIHAAWNCFQGSVLGIPVSGTPSLPSAIFHLKLNGPSYLSGGAFGVEGSWLTVLVLAAACYFLYTKIRHNKSALS